MCDDTTLVTAAVECGAACPLARRNQQQGARLPGLRLLLQVLLGDVRRLPRQAQGCACPQFFAAWCCSCWYTMFCWDPTQGKTGAPENTSISAMECVLQGRPSLRPPPRLFYSHRPRESLRSQSSPQRPPSLPAAGPTPAQVVWRAKGARAHRLHGEGGQMKSRLPPPLDDRGCR